MNISGGLILLFVAITRTAQILGDYRILQGDSVPKYCNHILTIALSTVCFCLPFASVHCITSHGCRAILRYMVFVYVLIYTLLSILTVSTQTLLLSCAMSFLVTRATWAVNRSCRQLFGVQEPLSQMILYATACCIAHMPCTIVTALWSELYLPHTHS